jgi:hypothetical protein
MNLNSLIADLDPLAHDNLLNPSTHSTTNNSIHNDKIRELIITSLQDTGSNVPLKRMQDFYTSNKFDTGAASLEKYTKVYGKAVC